MDVKTTLSEREGNTVKLAVEVSSEELQEAFNKNLRELSREARIPGFRPGKAPLAMIRQRMGDEAILANTIEESMSGWFVAALLELGLDPVDQPKIEFEGDKPELGKAFAFVATVTVMPELVLGEYKGVEAPKEPAVVEDEEVDAQMERLRNEFAELRPIYGRSVQNGDFVTADFRATSDGSPVEGFDASDFVFEVGGGRTFPEIEENAVGMSTGDERTFVLTVPATGEDQAKTVDCTMTVKEIKEKVLPQVSDRWASEVSEFATLLELRLEIRRKLQAGKTYASDHRFRALAVKAVADSVTVDLPEVAVREKAEEMLADFKRSLESEGGSFADYVEASQTTVEQMIEDLKPSAANSIKTNLALDAVAKAEGIVITDEDVGRAINQMAAVGGVDPKEFEARLRKSERIEPIRLQMRREKAADFIAANAIAVAPDAVQAKVVGDEAAGSLDGRSLEEALEPVAAEPAAFEQAAETAPEGT